jgi:hypothetical protein
MSQRMPTTTRVREIRDTIHRLERFSSHIRWDENGDEIAARIDAEYLVELLEEEIAYPVRGRPKQATSAPVVQVIYKEVIREIEVERPAQQQMSYETRPPIPAQPRRTLTLRLPSTEQS